MKPKYIGLVSVGIAPVGHYRSVPAEVGSPIPSYPVLDPAPMEHPQEMSGTVEVGIPPMEPANDSTLATECLPESPVDRSAAPGVTGNVAPS